MYEGQKDGSPVFRFSLDGSVVTVMFSEGGVPGVKERVRDILMESYKERFNDKVQALAQRQ